MTRGATPMKKAILTAGLIALAVLTATPSHAYWFGNPGRSLGNRKSSLELVYDTGTREIVPKNGGQSIDMDSSRFYGQFWHGFGNGLEFFGRVMPETGKLDFENS